MRKGKRRDSALSQGRVMRKPLQAELPASGAPKMPIHIRAAREKVRPITRAYVRRKLGMKFRKFADSIERVSVRVEDVNGPRGGVDQSCRIKVALRGLPSVVFESRDASLNAAVDVALSGAQRATQRRRMKPLRRIP